MLLAALSVGSCELRPIEYDHAELRISIYIPDVLQTKAETGLVNPVSDEGKISKLQVWVFLPSGTLVTYKEFVENEGNPAFHSNETGLLHGVVTRFGLPLTDEMFETLSATGATADVYAVANAAAGWNLTEGTSREELKGIVLEGNAYGGTTETMTTSVPAAGLPMSGVLESQPVTGGYPVLNISELTLTRAVSKIRFVFTQQGTMTPGQDELDPTNQYCCIKSITFDGTDGGHDCQIANKEKLFTQLPFDISGGYTPLSATLPGISHQNITTVLDPALLIFGASGAETAQQYEARLDAMVAPESQSGPIYIRETDKLISGTIVYNTTGNDSDDKTARFSLPLNDPTDPDSYDRMSRNHSWVVYAYFAEETKTLQLNVEVLPWTWTGSYIDYKSGSVNVIRRFSVFETDPQTFRKVKTDDGYYNIYFWPTVEVDGQTVENIIKGDIIIDTPVGATLHAIPGPGTLKYLNVEGQNQYTQCTDAITIVNPDALIYHNYSTNVSGSKVEHCLIEFEIKCNRPELDDMLNGNYIDLYFCVQIGEGDGVRYVDLHSESIDYYRFILWKDWKNSIPPETPASSGNG